MRVTNDTTRGVLHVDGFIDEKCFASWKDFLEALPLLLSVELPEGYSGILVQTDQPSEDDKTKLWARASSNGDVVGLYAFQKGAWHPFYTGGPTDVTWQFGDSSKLDGTGYQLIDDGDTSVPPQVVSVLKAQYVQTSHDPLVYAYYATRFVGF